MPDDRLQQGLDSYADHLRRTAGPPAAAEIRRRGDRRRRNRTTTAAFAAVLIAAAGLGAVLTRGDGTPVEPVLPAGTPPSPSAVASRTGGPTSDVSKLREIGITLEAGTVLDVSDDGVPGWLAVDPGGTVDFTGSVKDASTEMSLLPAPVRQADRVVIVPVATPGRCVTDTGGLPLVLQPCRDGAAEQTWEVVPAGDSGLFNLIGPHGELRTDGTGMVRSGGWSGVQTIPFDR
ncbi:MAG TPA: hypothetical protein VN408_23655 [Actinoplanes sp.]|nr:hypothetical protein [Actinoplanes sp.]